jgi:hypothetical protein
MDPPKLEESKSLPKIPQETTNVPQPKRFSEDKDYKQTLDELKKDFTEKYEKQEPSGDNLAEFNPTKVLGRGAFGVVVRGSCYFLEIKFYFKFF